MMIGLVVVTALTIRVIVVLLRAPRFSADAGPGRGPDIDWLGDAVAVANRESRWFGPLRPVLREVVGWLDRTLVKKLRRHPVIAAAAASAVFGLGVGLNQGIREGYFLASTLLTVGLLACGMFAFLMLAGSYLGLVRSGSPMHGFQRRILDASVIACAAAIVTLAFRNSLWPVIGTNASAAGNGQFASLLGAAMLLAFSGTLIRGVGPAHALPPGGIRTDPSPASQPPSGRKCLPMIFDRRFRASSFATGRTGSMRPADQEEPFGDLSILAWAKIRSKPWVGIHQGVTRSGQDSQGLDPGLIGFSDAYQSIRLRLVRLL